MTTTTTATYTKLRDGSWGIRGTGLVAGEMVVVSRRDGTSSRAQVQRILWTGADGTQLASLVPCGSIPSAKGWRSGPVTAETRTCWECGRRFTYAECRRHDGEWSDSYCGC